MTELEHLVAQQTPYRLAQMAAHRLARQREREAERARLAGVLLAASVGARRGKRFSMSDAALARIAAGANEGSDMGHGGLDGENVVPGANGAASSTREDAIPDKRRLRGEARKAARAAKVELAPLPPSTLGKVRGNGRAKRARVAR